MSDTPEADRLSTYMGHILEDARLLRRASREEVAAFMGWHLNTYGLKVLGKRRWTLAEANRAAAYIGEPLPDLLRLA